MQNKGSKFAIIAAYYKVEQEILQIGIRLADVYKHMYTFA